MNTILSQAQEMCRILDTKKAQDILLLNVEHMTVIADYLLLCSAHSTLQVQALCDDLEGKLKENYGLLPARTDGYAAARWIVLDYGAIIVHIFHEQEREFYNLERLWLDGENTVQWEEQ